MGRKQLKDDYAKAAQKYGPETGIKDLQYDPETICFSYEANNKSTSFTVYISDDYPEGTTLYPADGEPKYFSENLSYILGEVVAEYGKKFGATTTVKRTESDMYTQQEPKKIKTPVYDDYEDEDEDEDDDDDEDGFEMVPQLREEMAHMRKLYGTNILTERQFGAIDLLNLDLNVSYPFQHSVASAWGVKEDRPISIRMQLSPSMYLNSLESPKIDILQDSQMCGLSTQLSFIVKAFCSAHWANFASAQFTARKLRTSGTGNIRTSGTKFPELSIHFQQNTIYLYLKQRKEKKVEPNVQHLMDMGFAEAAARSALSATEGDLEQATNLLLESPSFSFSGSPPSSSSSNNNNNNNNKSKRGSKGSKSSKGDFNETERKDIFAQEEKDKAEQNFVVDYSAGFLDQLHRYVLHRIPSLNKFCIICDKAHLFASSLLLRPAVCARELCCFAFQNLGVCAGATDGIATQAEVVDLLVCMARAASESDRRDSIFDPYPTVFDPFDSSKMVLNPKKKDFSILDNILKNFPSVEDMTLAQEAKDMKDYMDRIDIYSFPLLQWIINSNRAHIEKLHVSKHLKAMNTPHQYVLVTAPPEKEEVFNKLKAKHGTFFAFHGSPVENWHCILRTGLRNASGTKLQLNGAAYGNGIYLSPAASMSFGYSQRSRLASRHASTNASASKSRFLSSSNFYCVALCEVANIPNIKKNGDIWVCPEEDPVVTRFFFVFPSGHSHLPTAHTSHAAFLAEVNDALRS